jgi:Carboxypeptidase regulatory-like domain
MTRPPISALLVSILVLVASACGSAAATPSPTSGPSGAPPSPSSPVVLPVTTPDQAAQLVVAGDARFLGIERRDPNVIGGCCFYDASANGDGSFEVTIEIGWGDCPSGCVNRHHWVYSVAADGTVALQREDGPPVPASTGGGSGGSDGGGAILPSGPGIAGQALAGPTCPVVKPGDPNCNDRPVAGASILIRDATGTVVAQMTTDADGRFHVSVPPGDYRVEPQPVEGLMGGANTIEVTVGATFKEVQIAYDTGIR